MAQLRRISGEGFQIHQSPLGRLFLRWILFFTWPLRTSLQILRMNLRHASRARKLSGKGRLRQLLEASYVAGRYFLPAKHYYVYGLFRARDWSTGLNCLNESEAGNLFSLLNKGAQSPVIEDKLVFAEWGREHDLSVVPTAACFGGNSNQASLPDTDAALFVKPLRGNKGSGCESWAWEGGTYTNREGQKYARTELATHLQERASNEPVLVQPRLQNHPDLTDLSHGPLAAVRLITGRRPDGRIELVAATFKMPTGTGITNNHGISSRVDLDTGELGPAIAYSPFHDAFESHPETGGKIAARRLPDWEAAKSLGLAAHGHLPDYVFIGWDIAIADRGPVLLEGNANWDTLSIQKSHMSSLIELYFADLCQEYLEGGTARVNEGIE